MEKMPWFKWWDGTTADIKLRMIAESSGTSVAVVLGIWAYLLEKASTNEDRGYIGGIDRGLMNYTLKLDDVTVETVCNGFKVSGIVTADDYVTEWDKRQAKRENQEPSGSSTERVRALRERRKAAAAAALTDGNAGNEQSNDETDETTSNDTKRPKRKRKEEEEEGDKEKADTRGTRLPKDWHPTAEETAFCKAERPDLRPSEVAQRFFDHWIAQPGVKGRKVDWAATWRNWVRNERVERRTAQRQTGAAGDKFSFGDVDRSSDKLGQQQTMERHNIVVPEGDIEI